ncbi:MAG: hydrogenase maturation protease [Thermoproteota archaeon]
MGIAKDIKVICCGNMLASDDGVGPAIAKELCSLNLPENVEVVDAGTSGLSIVKMILGVRKVIFVDATITGAKPGTVRRLFLDQLEETEKEMKISLHELSLVEALRIAREVYSGRMPAEVVLIGIEAESIVKPRIGLTKSVEDALPDAVRMILHEIHKIQ